MRVLFVTSECAPLFKRGGLGDVSHSLPVALQAAGVSISVAMPYYEAVKPERVRCSGQLAVDFDGRRELVFVFTARIPGSKVPVLLFRHPQLNNYNSVSMTHTFAFFSRVIAQFFLYAGADQCGPFDIVHCNDWHTALVPLLLGEVRKKERPRGQTLESRHSKTILTIHNLLYQGDAGVDIAHKLGIATSRFHTFATPKGRRVKFLVEGMEYADTVTTVSPTYAKEIRHGYHGDLVRQVLGKRGDKFSGILNGIDAEIWDPASDVSLPVHYTKKTVMAGKAAIKTHLRRALGLSDNHLPLFGFVGRLESRQKGIDLIAHAVKSLAADTYQLVLLGTGAKAQVTLFRHLSASHPNIAFVHTFDERLARRIYAGSDVMLVPSKFEPCGLTQLIAMRYGTLPLVRKTGGLADTVVEGKSGFVFGPYSRTALIQKMRQAIDWFHADPAAWQKMVRYVMAQDFSWKKRAADYVRLYRNLLKG